jgi:lauroyl/myristoyl acyltransferase
MTVRDCVQTCKILLLTIAAWCASPRYWRKAALLTAKIDKRNCRPPVYDFILGQTLSEAEIADIVEKRHAYTRELKFQILGLAGPWRSWRPDTLLSGQPILQHALRRGRGVILWVVETTFSTLIVKMALHKAGYYACQLSRPGHGFSTETSFGLRYLNPIWTGVEDRFIAERIVIEGESATDALRRLRERLAKNAIVMITLAPLAHKFADVPFFKTHVQLPTGPVRLAQTTGASLLPVFAFAKPDGGFEIAIKEPVHPINGPDSTNDITAAYAKCIEALILEHPDQWAGWDWLPSRLRLDSPPVPHSLIGAHSMVDNARI